MRRSPVLFLCLAILLAPSGLSAQEAEPQPLQIGPSGQAYLDALRYSGVESDVAYFDPAGAVPRLETEAEPAAPPRPGGGGGGGGALESLSPVRVVLILLATAVLAGLAVLVFRGAGGFTLSLQDDVQNPARSQRGARAATLGGAGPPADLRAILAVTDRRRALVMLAQAALTRTVAANGLLLQASWTMRDALRRIPGSQRHLDALRDLVMAGERVLFGNRDVTEAEFQAQVAAVRPLMGEGAA